MIYTLTLNPSLDYVIRVNEFRTGKINRTTSEAIYPGGKGLNVSRVLKNLGHDSTALGFLAGFTGRNIDFLMSDKGIKTSFIYVEEGLSRINVKLHSNDETEINGQGPVITSSDVDKLYNLLDLLVDGDILVLAGSIPSNLPKTIYRDICKNLYGKSVKTVVDAEGSLLMDVLEYRPFLIKPNNHELSDIFGITIDTKELAIQYAKKLVDAGARNVIISMAAEGAVMVNEMGNEYSLNAPRGTVVNSVGAGDSVVAGFLSGFLEGKGYEYAFRLGVNSGSASAFASDLATGEAIMELMNRNIQ